MFKNNRRKIVSQNNLIETIIDEGEESDLDQNFQEEEKERDLSIIVSQAGEEDNKDN